MNKKKDNVIELKPTPTFEQMKNETFEALSKDIRGMMMFLDMIVLASKPSGDGYDEIFLSNIFVNNERGSVTWFKY